MVVAGRFNESLAAPHFRRTASLFLLPLCAFVLAACSRKALNIAQIHAVTRDLVAAARKSAGPSAHVSIRPEMRRSADGGSEFVADDISIELPRVSNRAALIEQIERALDHAAARHHLLRSSQAASSGAIRFAYSSRGRLTHFIQIRFVESNPFAASPVHRGAPRLAIIIDDMGNDESAAAALFKLPYPLTFSVLPDQPHSAEIADQAFHRGDQVLLHLPMEFEGHLAKAEPVELRVGMPASQVDQILAEMLARVPHAIGVNNHEGSLATSNPRLMSELMNALRRRNLFFIDSRTTPATVAFHAAEHAGVRAASRKVFLDDVETRHAILRQLNLAARDAARNGSAIAIGHPHAATIAALAEALPRLNSRVRLVFASSLAR